MLGMMSGHQVFHKNSAAVVAEFQLPHVSGCPRLPTQVTAQHS